jgi:hypothetical protein
MTYLVDLKNWFAAIVFLLIVVLFWLALFIAMSPLLIPVFLISLFKDEAVLLGKKIIFKQWARNMFISQDQGANAMLGGSMDNHVSGRVGYNAIRGNGIALKMEIVINLFFKIFFKQDNHCRAAIEFDEAYNKNWGG